MYCDSFMFCYIYGFQTSLQRRSWDFSSLHSQAMFMLFVVLAPDSAYFYATTVMLHLTKLFPGLEIFKYWTTETYLFKKDFLKP